MITTRTLRRALAVGCAALTTSGVVALRADRGAARIQPVPATNGAAAASPVGTTSVSPAYLPPGARLVAADPAPSVRFPEAREHQYQLAGAANADTIPSGGLTEDNREVVHPATLLSVSFTPYVRTLPAIGDPAFVDVTTVIVGGWPAVLSTPKDGLGVQRVDWVDAEGYHVVMCDRLDHVEGIAGVEPEELVRVARSLYE